MLGVRNRKAEKCDKAVVSPCGWPSSEPPTRPRNAQPDCAYHGSASDQLLCRLTPAPVSYRKNPQEKGQKFVAVAHRCRNPGTGLGPFGGSYSARDAPVRARHRRGRRWCSAPRPGGLLHPPRRQSGRGAGSSNWAKWSAGLAASSCRTCIAHEKPSARTGVPPSVLPSAGARAFSATFMLSS